MTEQQIEHDEAAHRFSARAGGGEAYLTYATDEQGILDIVHTVVPAAARGHGLGEALVRAALAYARERGYRVIPSCPFALQWIVGHPDQQDVLAPQELWG